MKSKKSAKKNPLSLYNQKRDFKKTPEPEGKVPHKKGFSYLIQKHAASHLHYDFRLELDGTLKSWAVAKGPSIDPEVKRLAIEVEDHPVAYGSFEGIIPKGQYGGGTVMLWDNGTWQPEGDAQAALKKGHLNFELFGKRLKGKWSLIRIRSNSPKYSNNKNNWLLIKKDDEFANHGDEDELLKKSITSIVSSRTMEEIAEEKNKVWQSNKKNLSEKPAAKSKVKFKPFIKPQLATLSDHTPQGENWIHEIKFDGYRNLAYIESGEVKMLTRNNIDWTDRYPTLVKELQKLPVKNAILDGEIVALDKEQRSNFLTLQEYLKAENDEALQYYLFDILYLDGRDLTALPLLERKAELKKILEKKKLRNIFYSEHFDFQGEKFFKKLCHLNYEGLVSKLTNQPYKPGRGKDWLKSKCHRRQEFVIGGYTLRQGHSNILAALLIGYYDNHELIYAGKVGTGLNSQSREDVLSKLKKLRQDKAPFAEISRANSRGVTFVKPELVCEVEFSEWTVGGALRHPSFQGLRLDKLPKQIKREVPIHNIEEDSSKNSEDKKIEPVKASKKNSQNIISEIKITHPERIVYPKHNLTKLDLVEYYDKISDLILPHLENRFISLVRCPQGLEGECFFQRHENVASPFVHELNINEGDISYIYIKDKKGLLSLIQFGVIEIHAWGSRIDNVNKPDRIVFDLDPDEKIPFEKVVEAAADIKLRLDDLGLDSFLRTTGGKGLHVVVPIKPNYEWEVVKAFCKAFAAKMESDDPQKYITNMNKEKRKGKIFIDYLRNDLTSTAITSFSARARENATVATPLAWEELDYHLDPQKFTITSIFQRLENLKSDPWKNFFSCKQVLKKKILGKFIKLT